MAPSIDESPPAPWASDRGELDEIRVRAALGENFPVLVLTSLRFLARGWDHDAWLASDAWVFRFPRRKEVATGVAAQIELSRILADALPVPVPRAELAGSPGPSFPYPFAGHRVLWGTAVDALAWSDAQLAGFAREFGAALAALHAIPTECVSALGLPVAPDRTPERRDGAVAIADGFRAAMPRDCVARWEPWLRGAVAMPPSWDGPLVLTHNDLAAEHVLVDPASRRITGVFDWSDAAIGDPAMDLIGLWLWRGESLVRRVLAHYPRRWDEGTIARVRFHAECLALLYVGRARRHRDTALLERERRFFLEHWEPLAPR